MTASSARRSSSMRKTGGCSSLLKRVEVCVEVWLLQRWCCGIQQLEELLWSMCGMDVAQNGYSRL